MDLLCWRKKHMFDGDEMKFGQSWGRGKIKNRKYLCIFSSCENIRGGGTLMVRWFCTEEGGSRGSRCNRN